MVKPKFGATGKFPDGKIADREDEGEIKFGITHTESEVVLDFGKPVAWLGMPPVLARQLASLLTKHADEIDKKSH